MKPLDDFSERLSSSSSPLAALSGAAGDLTLHDQLYRYAEDLQQMIERHGALEAHYGALREACTHLTENRNMLDELIGRSSDMHIVTDAEGRIQQSNPATAVLAPQAHFAGAMLRYWVQPTYRDAYDGLLKRTLSAGSFGEECELRLLHDAGERTPMIVSAQAIAIHRDGEVRSVHWILRDLTRLREIQFESQISSMVFNCAMEAVSITNVDGEILAVNPAFARITGYSAEEAVGRRANLLRSGMHDAHFYAEFWRALKEEGSWQGEIYNRKKSGEVYPGWLTVNAARDSDGKIVSYVAVCTDLSRILRSEKRLAHLAHHDMLTGLPNRLLFQDRLAQTLAQSRRTGASFSLIFVDLDRFKQINDTLGHAVGDRVLQEAAKRMQGLMREVDTVARLGGDEFVVIAAGLAGHEHITQLCEKMLACLARAICVDGRELFIGASLGCATYPVHGEDELLLLKHADVAMYQAKLTGGNAFAIHDMAGEDQSGRLHLETELRHALARGELHLEYQPQVNVGDGLTMGVEALLRWNHPQLGNINPAQFIPIAEQIGLIVPIGAWVLETACHQLARWDAAGLPAMSMAVNLSPRQLRDATFVARVSEALAASKIAAHRLELEITESEIIAQLEVDRSKLGVLRELGVKIAIDDFGTGHSSLARLMQLPIDRLKLDRSFICELEGEGEIRARAITAAIVTMGHALGVGLIAEGVETVAQYALLSEQGCHAIQGFLTGRPMRPEDLPLWLQDQAAQGNLRGFR